MDKNPSNKMDGLVELLPEGLTEHAVEEIAQLVDTIITDRVGSEVDGLITKVNAFMRMKVDEIKDYALKELQQDEEFVRNGHIYENVKSLMAIELDQHDKESAISDLVNVNEESQGDILTLTSEVEKLMEDNQTLVSITEALEDKINNLENKHTELVEENRTLVESQKLPFESSEKAVMVSNADAEPSTPENEEVLNEFLTPEVMRFMPIAE